MRSTKLEVNLSSFYENVKNIKKLAPNKEIMPVIKANAYGTYINKRLDVLNHFSIVAVALVEEGVEIRKLGYQGDIFVLNQPSIHDIDDIIEYQLTVGLSNLSFLDECISRNASFPVHLEIETGMNRTGILFSELNLFLDTLENSNLIVEGIYSHFSSADFDSEYSNLQIENFSTALNYCESRNYQFKYIHMEASNGLLNCNLDFTNLIRPGLLLYGYEPFHGAISKIPLKPVCRLLSEVTFLKTVPEGSKIGYSQKYTCDIDTSVATIPIGYGDGYRRSLSNKGNIYINHRKAPIIGSICMDSFMVDVTGIRVQVGDEVVLFDSNHILLDELADLCDTINYELLCTIGDRVPRVFNGGENE